MQRSKSRSTALISRNEGEELMQRSKSRSTALISKAKEKS